MSKRWILIVLLLLVGAACRKSANDAHYAEVEQHRQQQAAQASPSATASPSPSPSPSISPSPGADTAAAAPAPNYWTNFRGPKRDGKYEEGSITTSWPASGLPVLWKQPVGLGHASFVIADNNAYTIEQRRGQEVVAAYDVASGRELWAQKWNAEYTDSTGDGPRATPTWDQGRIYALGATGELRCLDANGGKVIWGKNILSDNQARNLPWAMAASPLIVDDKVIVLPGGTSGKSVVAYNKMTGAPVWRVLNDTQAYVSPMLAELAGRRQIVVVSSSRVVGLAPENGALLWSYAWDTDSGINVSQPVMVDQNRFFISSGYGKGAALVEVKRTGDTFTASTIWENTNMKNKFNSSVLYNGYIYGLDEGILVCLDVNTGERKWKNGRYGYGQVILAGSHLIVSSDKGEVALVRATPAEYTELARFPAVQGQTWNYPAIAGGRLLVRNSNEMAAYDISAK
jgi:outer membrane protein assembly factor BamB